MCGPHDEYLSLYHHHFNALESLLNSGKKIYFFEGNHDVHLERLFKKKWANQEIVLTQKPIIEVIEGKHYYFSHGDEHETDNLSYHRYMKFIRSRPLKFIADYVMPYAVLNFFGQRASKMSRKKGARKFDPEKVRSKFRTGVMEITNGEFDFVLGGHSHVKDEFKINDGKSWYLNNGYALQSKTFILIEDHQAQFVPLM
jgi:UDP-2,3-diacylglucosamine hydrolase